MFLVRSLAFCLWPRETADTYDIEGHTLTLPEVDLSASTGNISASTLHARPRVSPMAGKTNRGVPVEKLCGLPNKSLRVKKGKVSHLMNDT